MKILISFCLLLTTALLSRPALANSNPEDTPIAHCFKQAMPRELVPQDGNQSFFNWWSDDALTLQTISAEESRVAYAPNGISHSDDYGTWQTAHGPVNYEKRMDLETRHSLSQGQMQTWIHFRNEMTDNQSVDVELSIPDGIPYVLAHRQTTVSCSVDSYGQNVCNKPVHTDTHFEVIMPKHFQSTARLINIKTNQSTAFVFDNEKYRSCLTKLYPQN